MKENYNIRGTGIKYTLHIESMVFQKIMFWVDKAPGEVSGLGKLTIDKDTGIIKITEAILVKQVNGAASTELDPQAVGKAMYAMRDVPGHLNFWWHSHVNMQVFWSGTDMNTIREIGQHGFLVSTVFNKKREMKSSFYRKADEIFAETFIDDIPTKIIDMIPVNFIEEWTKEFNEKCEVEKYETPTYPLRRLYPDGEDYGQEIINYSDKKKDDEEDNFEVGDEEIDEYCNFDSDDQKILDLYTEIEPLKDEMLELIDKEEAKDMLREILGLINEYGLKDKKKEEGVKAFYIKQFKQMVFIGE